MIRNTLALAMILGLAACSPTGEPTAPTAASTPPSTAAAPTAAAPTVSALDAAVAGDWRDPANVARDAWRHPVQTLQFFGLSPDQTVVEITPGGGWYSEILAPLLRDQGHYVAAIVDPESASSEDAKAYYRKNVDALNAKLSAAPEVYGAPELRLFDLAKPVFGEPASADVVLTFRNVHNWQRSETAEVMFQGFFDVLKPGGTLGVVEHRAKGEVAKGDASGYVGQDQVIALATAAGFVLDASSEINANPADSKDHPAGVWSLPPALRLGDKDREKYTAI
ncbi:MAG: class I SAM-dependent methyltransferase, partial [Lysobacterales bacterium]